jgi:hypothetical protein
MGMLKNLRLKFHFKALHNELNNRKPSKDRSAVTWKGAKSIGILFDANEPDHRKRILKYADELRKKGKQVRLLGYLSQHQEGEEFPFRTFSPKEQDWRYCPKSEEVREFMSQSFDLLFFLGLHSTLWSEYVAALSKAKLRVGPSTEHTYAYDLMIEVPEKAGLPAFITQMENLLGKTNTPYEAATAT